MGGQRFEYDESGGTFFSFLLSFLALLLIPGTYYYWPRKNKSDVETLDRKCNCESCLMKRSIMRDDAPWHGVKQWCIRVVIVLGWVLLLSLAYKVSQFDYEMAGFDPYEILGVSPDASQSDIKKTYRKLSLMLHPDKETGDERLFMKLTKAYQALTDDTARKNWENYGNPDGPGAVSFGIALPAWIVEKDNSLLVLGVYGLVIMLVLPTAVGMWWYRSIRYTADKVLLHTTQLYYCMFMKTPNMNLKRMIMVLGASLEFEKSHNKEVVERYTDNTELPQLIRKLTNLGEKNREKPLCFPYSVKARALIHAHLSRIPLNPDTLEVDRRFVINKCPHLIQEMVSCVAQLIVLGHVRSIPRQINIETLESVMRLKAMIIQGLWEFKNPLLQLPYVTEDNLKYFMTKRIQVRTIQQFAQLKPEERRSILRGFSEDQFQDVLTVTGAMPYVNFQVQCEVVDDELTKRYTVGAVITVTVKLVRQDLKVLFNVPKEEADEAVPKTSAPKSKGNKKNKKTKNWKAKAVKSAGDSSESEKDSEEENAGTEENVDDDLEWEKFQSKLPKRDNILEGASNLSHKVHCPFLPSDKQECWWVYVSDRKIHRLVSAPVFVTGLVDEKTIQLQFTGPLTPGNYTVTVCLRSDCYLGFDQLQDVKLNIVEATEVPDSHPQWEIVSDEDLNDASDLSDLTTDDDDDDD